MYRRAVFPTIKIHKDTYKPVIYERYETLRQYAKLRGAGYSQHKALKELKVSRSTLYRWIKAYKDKGVQGFENGHRGPHNPRKTQWSKSTEELVLALRRKYRSYGKMKLNALLQNEHGRTVSASTIGRILKKLIDQGTIKQVHRYARKRSSRNT